MRDKTGNYFATLMLAVGLYFSTQNGSVAEPKVNASLSDQAIVGEKIFFDTSLSASGKLSCATCHDPDHAHAPSNGLATQLGGINVDVTHFRATPSLRYLNETPPFGRNAKGVLIGGFNRDGHADTLSQQAAGPLLSPVEMANKNASEVVDKVRKTKYLDVLQRAFDLSNSDSSEKYFAAITSALEAYQLENSDFHPFSSKYDMYLDGKIQLTESEHRGLELFNNKNSANCASCHVSQLSPTGKHPLFTDFTYDALGIMRNQSIAANSDEKFFDTGVCMPGVDLKQKRIYEVDCGKFKVPTLRNVATRKVFFHNGKITSLRDAIAFYATRDTDPAHWYGRDQDGRIHKFNDLPEQYRDNVNQREKPYDRGFGRTPRLSEEDITYIEAFLNTLTDGYSLTTAK